MRCRLTSKRSPETPFYRKHIFMKTPHLFDAALPLFLSLSLLAAAPAWGQNAITAASAQEAGAQLLPSGMVYRSLQQGSGASPKATDEVTVHYRGTLPDGQEFDSSYKRNKSIDFPLNRVIPCWTEGLQLMKVGGKAKLTCPPNTAYGSRGAGSAIPPNATLFFEVELLAVNGK